jgi:sulfane dehydrogenase subunit SoxC
MTASVTPVPDLPSARALRERPRRTLRATLECAGDERARRWARRRWTMIWNAERPGPAQLCYRATDASGAVQPLESPWNRQGMANNGAQRVEVFVR